MKLAKWIKYSAAQKKYILIKKNRETKKKLLQNKAYSKITAR